MLEVVKDFDTLVADIEVADTLAVDIVVGTSAVGIVAVVALAVGIAFEVPSLVEATAVELVLALKQLLVESPLVQEQPPARFHQIPSAYLLRVNELNQYR